MSWTCAGSVEAARGTRVNRVARRRDRTRLDVRFFARIASSSRASLRSLSLPPCTTLRVAATYAGQSSFDESAMSVGVESGEEGESAVVAQAEMACGAGSCSFDWYLSSTRAVNLRGASVNTCIKK